MWMCDLCFKEAMEIGILFPDSKYGYSIIYHENKYHILGGQGHNGDIIFTFKEKPFPDPDPECESEDENIISLSDSWTEKILRDVEEWKLMPEEGHRLVEEAIKLGYSQQESFPTWFSNYCGEIVKNYEDNLSK